MNLSELSMPLLIIYSYLSPNPKGACGM